MKDSDGQNRFIYDLFFSATEQVEWNLLSNRFYHWHLLRTYFTIWQACRRAKHLASSCYRRTDEFHYYLQQKTPPWIMQGTSGNLKYVELLSKTEVNISARWTKTVRNTFWLASSRSWLRSLVVICEKFQQPSMCPKLSLSLNVAV